MITNLRMIVSLNTPTNCAFVAGTQCSLICSKCLMLDVVNDNVVISCVVSVTLCTFVV